MSIRTWLSTTYPPQSGGASFVTSSATLPRGYACVAYGNGMYVAGGSLGHIALSEDNGKTWQEIKAPFSSDFAAIAFGGRDEGRFIAVAVSGQCFVSEGGQTWRAGAALPAQAQGQRPHNIFYDGITFVVTYENLTSLLYGDGLTTWKASPLQEPMAAGAAFTFNNRTRAATVHSPNRSASRSAYSGEWAVGVLMINTSRIFFRPEAFADPGVAIDSVCPWSPNPADGPVFLGVGRPYGSAPWQSRAHFSVTGEQWKALPGIPYPGTGDTGIIFSKVASNSQSLPFKDRRVCAIGARAGRVDSMYLATLVPTGEEWGAPALAWRWKVIAVPDSKGPVTLSGVAVASNGRDFVALRDNRVFCLDLDEFGEHT